MIDDELPMSLQTPAKGAAALSGLMREDLDPYSVEDLEERIVLLEGEIRRARDAVERKKNRRSAADALFSFKGS
jgi:uncharacterized small protein (DUF1192 family)